MVPTPLWLVLFLAAAVIGAYMLFFADSGERARVQALLIGSVVSVVAATFLLLSFLDNPYHGGVGTPAAGRDGAHTGDPRAGARARGTSRELPCTESGEPR